MASMRPDGLSLGELIVEDPAQELPDAVGLSLHEVIGSGGSAVVRMATQRSLAREVAVKQPREEKLRWVLLREARITGRLQHPNILPVYDIVRSEEGDPLILMKRVGGQNWTQVMAGLSLEDNLRILLQVCNAVAFAHSQGVIHRDLKPDNVMIGEFGEVVVLDWGLAVRTEHLDEPWIPLASDQSGIAGTPAFMAPEMLGGVEVARARGIPLKDLPSPGVVGPRTDVFCCTSSCPARSPIEAGTSTRCSARRGSAKARRRTGLRGWSPSPVAPCAETWSSDIRTPRAFGTPWTAGSTASRPSAPPSWPCHATIWRAPPRLWRSWSTLRGSSCGGSWSCGS